jgi:hypothetical protein
MSLTSVAPQLVLLFLDLTSIQIAGVLGGFLYSFGFRI